MGGKEESPNRFELHFNCQAFDTCSAIDLYNNFSHEQ